MSADDFSFKAHAIGPQSAKQTHLIMTYELGRLIEYNHKANIYGASGYYCIPNQQKEMSDLISMSRYLCELYDWNYKVLLERRAILPDDVVLAEDVLRHLVFYVGMIGMDASEYYMSYVLSYMNKYCSVKSWRYSILETIGEQAYLERMDDIKAHAVKR